MNEKIYRGFKIVEDEDTYVLYEIGKKKPRDFFTRGGKHIRKIEYDDFFTKMSDELKGQNHYDYIFRYIDKFIKERRVK